MDTGAAGIRAAHQFQRVMAQLDLLHADECIKGVEKQIGAVLIFQAPNELKTVLGTGESYHKVIVKDSNHWLDHNTFVSHFRRSIS